MEIPLTEENLENIYGTIYTDLFGGLGPVRKEEIDERNDVIIDYLLTNPSEIFKINNPETIRIFINTYDKDISKIHRTYKEYQKYLQFKKDWNIIKGGILSKPVIGKILDNLSFVELVETYRTDKLREIIDKSRFWEVKLQELNKEHDADFGKLLEIDNVKDVVLVTMGIIAILPFRRHFSINDPNIIDEFNISDIYEFEELDFNTDNKDFPKILEYLLPFLINLHTLFIRGGGIRLFTRDTLTGGQNLTQLMLDGNNTVKSLPRGLFLNLRNLRHLEIKNNNLGKLDTYTFEGLDNLESLALIGNNITSLEDGIFNGMNRLGVLIISHENITELPLNIFQGLDNLQRLDLSRNDKLTHIRWPVFRPIIHTLNDLNLTGNYKMTIPIQLQRIDHLYIKSDRM